MQEYYFLVLVIGPESVTWSVHQLCCLNVENTLSIDCMYDSWSDSLHGKIQEQVAHPSPRMLFACGRGQVGPKPPWDRGQTAPRLRPSSLSVENGEAARLPDVVS